jgi:hypothetical protein
VRESWGQRKTPRELAVPCCAGLRCVIIELEGAPVTRACFACDKPMEELWWGWMCSPCEVFELKPDGKTGVARASSWIDPDTGKEFFYLDHSEKSFPSPA